MKQTYKYIFIYVCNIQIAFEKNLKNLSVFLIFYMKKSQALILFIYFSCKKKAKVSFFFINSCVIFSWLWHTIKRGISIILKHLEKSYIRSTYLVGFSL